MIYLYYRYSIKESWLPFLFYLFNHFSMYLIINDQFDLFNIDALNLGTLNYKAEPVVD